MHKSIQSDQGESVLSVDYDNDYLGRRTFETIHTPGGTTADSKYTAYEYDALGRLTKLIKGWGLDPDDLNLTMTYVYDGHGLLETLTNPRGIVTRFEYDHRDRRVRTIEDAEVGGLNHITHFGYDGNDNVTSVIDANGQTTAHEYNNWDHLVRSVDAEGYETLFERDATGNLLRRDRRTCVGDGG